VTDRLDEVELRGQLAAATEDALRLADELCTAVISGPPVATPRVCSLASDFQEKHREVRQLRRAVAVEVAG
jgi:hypothetical protein